ncbi:MAG: hypothetical protein N2324_11775 [Thermus sp.]|nr:hypothetical protein [Thermus sp.]
MDESLGMMQRQAKGVFEGISRNSVVILDPLAAACYDTYAIFEPPIVRLQRELDPKKRAIFDRMGLSWDASKVRGRRDVPRAVDGMPYLTMDELARAYQEGLPPHEVLRKKWREWLSSGHDPSPSAPPTADGLPSLEEPPQGTFDWSRFSWSG